MPGPESEMDVAHNAAAGLKAGTDLNCGKPWAYKNISTALDLGLIDEGHLDATVARSMTLRLQTGMFDNVESQPYTRLGLADLGSEDHHRLALEAASKGLVLLQNPSRIAEAGRTVLPLGVAGTKTAIIGPHANSTRALLGSYFDQACPPTVAKPKNNFDCIITPAAAIAAMIKDKFPSNLPPVVQGGGCVGVACPVLNPLGLAAAVTAVKSSDRVVLLLGIDQTLEGEGHDRHDTKLPGMCCVLSSSGSNVALQVLNSCF